MTFAPRHLPVLPTQTIAALAPAQGECFLDCTAGLAGHASLIAPHLGPLGTIILCDLDKSNLTHATDHLQRHFPGTVVPIHTNFARVGHELAARGLTADMLLADLGFASNQMDDPARGFSFQADGPLDMRLDQSLPVTAAELVHTLPEAELVRILVELGEEHDARRIARKIVQVRALQPILTTHRLAETVRAALPFSRAAAHTGIHPATRTFQALRIAVNDELGSLDALLASVARQAQGPKVRWLAPGARAAVISFHSLEDRRVKRVFQSLASLGARERIKGCQTADEGELAANPRSRSAKLRAVSMPPCVP